MKRKLAGKIISTIAAAIIAGNVFANTQTGSDCSGLFKDSCMDLPRNGHENQCPSGELLAKGCYRELGLPTYPDGYPVLCMVCPSASSSTCLCYYDEQVQCTVYQGTCGLSDYGDCHCNYDETDPQTNTVMVCAHDS